MSRKPPAAREAARRAGRRDRAAGAAAHTGGGGAGLGCGGHAAVNGDFERGKLHLHRQRPAADFNLLSTRL